MPGGVFPLPLSWAAHDGVVVAGVSDTTVPVIEVSPFFRDQVLGINLPDYGTVEAPLEGFSARYSPAERFESSPEDKQW